MPEDVSAPLPDLSLKDKTIIEVDTGDPGAVVTGLVIHVSQSIPDGALPSLLPLLTYRPGSSA